MIKSMRFCAGLQVNVSMFLVLLLLIGSLLPVSAMPRRAEMKRNAHHRREMEKLRVNADAPTEHYYDARRDVRIHYYPDTHVHSYER